MNRACFPKEENQNSQKWAKFMNFSFWPFLLFGLPGRLLSYKIQHHEATVAVLTVLAVSGCHGGFSHGRLPPLNSTPLVRDPASRFSHKSRERKIQPKVFLTEVFGNPLGSWTSAPSGHGCPRQNACFPRVSRALDRSFGLGYPRE